MFTRFLAASTLWCVLAITAGPAAASPASDWIEMSETQRDYFLRGYFSGMLAGQSETMHLLDRYIPKKPRGGLNLDPKIFANNTSLTLNFHMVDTARYVSRFYEDPENVDVFHTDAVLYTLLKMKGDKRAESVLQGARLSSRLVAPYLRRSGK